MYENETIPWTPCGEVNGHLLECGSIEVPLDHFDAKFSARKFGFDIAVIRLRARNLSHGRNLLIHPGNPGDSGMGFIYKHGGHLRTIVGEEHHIVSFDTRGLNASWPQVQCFRGESARKKNLNLWYKYIKRKEDVHAIWKKSQKFVNACEANMGRHGKHINSLQIAADIETIRKGLGQDTLDFWGLSYGGVLGHTYSMLFPDRVGRVILDGSLCPKNWFGHRAFDGLDYQVTNSFARFIERCHSNRATCPFEQIPDDFRALDAQRVSFLEKIKTLKTPIKVRLNHTHHGLIGRLDLWTKGIIPALGSPLKWHDLASRLASLMRGDPEEAFLAYGTYYEPSLDGLVRDDYYDLLVLNDYTSVEWYREDLTGNYELRTLKAILDIEPAYFLEFERWSQAQQWRNPLATSVIMDDRFSKAPANPIMYISAGEPYATRPHSDTTALSRLDNQETLVIENNRGHTSISMPSKCVALAIREFLDGRPPTSQIDPDWGTHLCHVDGPEFTPPDDLEANARKIVGNNEEDVRLYLAQVALARDTNWRIL
ncbi:unnamed protein product [Clonostachys rosea]|uniref:AB hydrolase-1 domain-containing protein n=1 Tax=Bionectria ochroleuca TaxID=29856 RepID=A0ABY6V6A1_BIOOC|nr:unnamed protein product [Clonostachys rosea]